ncbi:MAG TPA: hypothetical protein VJJ79_02895 [Candidatus Nanoarchaeia archaeon]|nr:hypothetical protein [Candidatus Nanoarchaeia archaeon]
MKLSNEMVEDLARELVGDDVLPLVRLLLKKDNVSEFKLAEDLNVTVNQTRNMLYRMNEHNLVSFLRKKDKKKGWYIYYWSLNRRSVANAMKKQKSQQLEMLKERLGREQESVFYVCPTGCMRMKMEHAMEVEFRCQECGALLQEQNNQKTIANIQRMIDDIEKVVLQEEEKRQIPKKQLVKKKSFKKAVKKLVKAKVKKKFGKKK